MQVDRGLPVEVRRVGDLELLAESIGDNPNAVTRFVLVSRTVAPPSPTGADKTSLIAELPDDHESRER